MAEGDQNPPSDQNVPPPATASNLQPFISQMWTDPVPPRPRVPHDVLGTGTTFVPGPMPSQTPIDGDKPATSNASMRAEAGGFTSRSIEANLVGASASAEAGELRAETSPPLTKVVTDLGAPFEVVSAVGDAAVTAKDTVEAEVVRAPFSEIGIAERLAQNPDFYQRLMRFVAANLRDEAANYKVEPGKANSAAVLKAEMLAQAEKFESAAAALEGGSSDRFATAANFVLQVCDGISTFANEHPELKRIFFSLAGVAAGCLALHHICGVSPDVAAAISYAVISRGKLPGKPGDGEDEDGDG